MANKMTPKTGKVRLDPRPRQVKPPTQREQSQRDVSATRLPSVTIGNVDASTICKKGL